MKYDGEYPIWVFVEIIPFGRLTKFYRFVAEKMQDRKMIKESYMLLDVRELRNACVHNNCIINDLRSNTSKYKVNYEIISEMSKIGISKRVRDNKLSNVRLKQLTTLLYLNRNIVTSEGVLNYQTKMLHELKDRILYHIDYYDTNELVQTSLEFLNKIIDKWYTSDI